MEGKDRPLPVLYHPEPENIDHNRNAEQQQQQFKPPGFEDQFLRCTGPEIVFNKCCHPDGDCKQDHIKSGSTGIEKPKKYFFHN